MKFEFFAFIQKHPIIGALIFASALLFSIPRTVDAAKVDGLISGSEESIAKISSSYIKESHSFKKSDHCSADVTINGAPYKKMTISCDETDKDEIPVVREGDSYISKDFRKGEIWFKLGFDALALWGLVYCLKRIKKPLQ